MDVDGWAQLRSARNYVELSDDEGKLPGLLLRLTSSRTRAARRHFRCQEVARVSAVRLALARGSMGPGQPGSQGDRSVLVRYPGVYIIKNSDIRVDCINSTRRISAISGIGALAQVIALILG